MRSTSRPTGRSACVAPRGFRHHRLATSVRQSRGGKRAHTWTAGLPVRGTASVPAAESASPSSTAGTARRSSNDGAGSAARTHSPFLDKESHRAETRHGPIPGEQRSIRRRRHWPPALARFQSGDPPTLQYPGWKKTTVEPATGFHPHLPWRSGNGCDAVVSSGRPLPSRDVYRGPPPAQPNAAACGARGWCRSTQTLLG